MNEREPLDEPPPIAGSWRRLYAGVVVYLAAMIALFWIFTRTYSR